MLRESELVHYLSTRPGISLMIPSWFGGGRDRETLGCSRNYVVTGVVLSVSGLPYVFGLGLEVLSLTFPCIITFMACRC
jgi:hypothetical protein